MNRNANGLNAIPGERIRRQYFNIPIYLILSYGTPFIFYFMLVCMVNRTSVSTDFQSFAMTSVILFLHLLIPLVILSVLNRFCFGKVVCVLNEKGLYFYDGKVRCIPWADIKEVTYEPDLPDTRRFIRPCYNAVHITTKPFKKKITTEILEVPFYLLGRMKKYHSKAKYRVQKFYIILLLSLPLVAGAMFACSALSE